MVWSRGWGRPTSSSSTVKCMTTRTHTDMAVSSTEPGPDESPVAVCAGLRKIFGERVAVDDIGFTIAVGQTYGLLGPNGAGKTTTISMLCGLVPPDSGKVTVAGQTLDRHAHDAKAAIGLVPQEIALYPDLTARENLDFFGRLQGLGRHHRRARIGEVLEVVGLTDRADDRDRIGIMDAGRMIAEGTRRQLITQIGEHDRIRLSTTDSHLDTLRLWARNSGPFLGTVDIPGGVEGQIDNASGSVARVVDGLEHAGVDVSGIEVIEPDLETVFLHLTGRALRD